MNENGFRLPTTRQRVAVMGRTGSGKTQFGSWLLSKAPFNKQPYIIIDYKGDDLLNSIPRVEEIGYGDVPKQPGLYIIHPDPRDADATEAWLLRIWKRGRTGLYVDEAYMLPDKGAFQGILTQGRSKYIPTITLTQRPIWISRFVFSEADFYAVFHLQDARDRQTIQAFMPQGTLKERLPAYQSRWYDVGDDQLFTLLPVPTADEILNTFDDRLQPNRQRI